MGIALISILSECWKSMLKIEKCTFEAYQAKRKSVVLQTFDIRVCGNFCCCTLISTSEALISHEGIIALNNLSEELIYYAYGEGILIMLMMKT